MDTLERIKNLKSSNPSHFILSNNVRETAEYLKKQGWIDSENALLSLEKPGEGNMNCVLRARVKEGKSFILKQARPWVEKYPDIDAPDNRLDVEETYYSLVSEHQDLQKYSPAIFGYDDSNKVMAMEDLGEASDLSMIYQRNENLLDAQISDCITYLNKLRKIRIDGEFPNNMGMRKLNHQHIFVLPFMSDNGFDLDSIQSGLQKLAKPIINDKELVSLVEGYGEIYLGEGDQLVHGDFYPGSILKTEDGLKVIDPEFGFIGPCEWDLAIFTAHLYMSESEHDQIKNAIQLYNSPSEFDLKRFSAFAGIEIIRRIIGLAQLPLSLSLSKKEELLFNAVHWIKSGKII